MFNFHLPHHIFVNICFLTIKSGSHKLAVHRSYTRAMSQPFIYSTKWSVHYIIANYLAPIEFVCMVFISELLAKDLTIYLHKNTYKKKKMVIQSECFWGCKFHSGMPIQYGQWAVISIKKWTRITGGSDLKPMWRSVGRNTFQTERNFNLGFISLPFLLNVCLSVKDDQQQVWENLSFSLSLSLSILTAQQCCVATLPALMFYSLLHGCICCQDDSSDIRSYLHLTGVSWERPGAVLC